MATAPQHNEFSRIPPHLATLVSAPAMPERPEPKTLIQKVADACNAIGGIEKRGKNKNQNYEYVMAADVAAAFRHELFARGIILLQDEESVEFRDYETNNGGVMQECRLKIKFTLKDDTGELASSAYGVGRDTFDKAIYKAKTGATKYFLRGLGLIPDRKDDPENSEDQEVVDPKREAPSAVPAPITPQYPPRKPNGEANRDSVPVGSILPFQKNAFLSAAKKSGKNGAQVTVFLHDTFGYDSLNEMPKKDFIQALKWAMEG